MYTKTVTVVGAQPQFIDSNYQPFGNSYTAEKICDVLRKWNR